MVLRSVAMADWSELGWGRWWIGAWVRVENAGIEEQKKEKCIYIYIHIYNFNERDNKIYYLILAFELQCIAINGCAL